MTQRVGLYDEALRAKVAEKLATQDGRDWGALPPATQQIYLSVAEELISRAPTEPPQAP